MGSGTTRARRRRVATVTISGLLALGAVAIGGISAADASARTAALRGTSLRSSVTPRTPLTALGDLTTYGYSNSRSGEDPVDPAINHLSAGPSWDATLDGSVYGQPLVYGGQVFVGTENDSVYALSAKTGKVAWRAHVGNTVSTSVIDQAPGLGGGCGNIDPLGITGTPVIDTAKRELFAAEETAVGGNSWQDIRHWLVAVSLTTHRELWHHEIDPPHANNPNYYYIPALQQRPAATLLDGRVYVEFGGLSGDCGQYHGYVVDVAETGRGGVNTYQVPSQREAAIWSTGGAFVSSKGNLYVATGNGSSDTLAQFDEGNAVVELSPSLHRLGYFAPSNWVQLNDNDWDLGSGGPVAVPDSSLLFVAGKPGPGGAPGFLMKDSPLGGIGHGAYSRNVCSSGNGVFGADATYVAGTGAGARVFVYAPCGNGTEAIEVHVTSPISFRLAWSPSTGSPNGSPIVAGGVVWALDWNNNILYGMNPITGHVEFVRTTDGLDHFVAPSVGDGRLYVPTQGGVEAFIVSR
jgi:polyvinyl alcohol dehydrogenase (cytochrome)